MKKLFENIAIALVVLLALLVATLIVQYNLIEDDAFENTIIITKDVPKKDKTTSYLDALEGYGEDQDVKVDPTKENSVNRVIVNEEENNNNKIKEALEDSHAKNLEDFTEDTKKAGGMQSLEDVAEPTAPAQAERVDEIGSALDDILGDM